MLQPALRAHQGNHSRHASRFPNAGFQVLEIPAAGNSCSKILVKTHVATSSAIWRIIQQYVLQAVVAREFHLLKVATRSAQHFDFHPRRVSWAFHACSERAAKSNGNL
jgi:hypothetical protein